MSLIKANAHQVGDYTLTNEGGKLVINQGTPDTVLNPVATFGTDGLEVGNKLLSGTSGSSLVGYDGGTVQDVLDAVTGPNGAASVGYTPAGSGAVTTTVQEKMREMVSVADFGASPSASAATNTAAIQAAADYAKNAGAFLKGLPGTYQINSTLTLNCSGDLSSMTLNVPGASISGPAVIVGLVSGSSYTTRISLKLPQVINSSKSGNNWDGAGLYQGVEIANVYHSVITVNYITGFVVGCDIGGRTWGNGLNTFNCVGYIHNNRVNLRVKPKSTGAWANDNLFIGFNARIDSSHSGISGTRNIQVLPFDAANGSTSWPNNNVFIKPAIEGDAPEYTIEISGSDNLVISPRLETISGSQRILLTGHASLTKTVRNTIIAGYSSSNYNFTESGVCAANSLISPSVNVHDSYENKPLCVYKSNFSGAAAHVRGYPLSATNVLNAINADTNWTYQLTASGADFKPSGSANPTVKVSITGQIFLDTGVSAPSKHLTGAAGAGIRSSADFYPTGSNTLSLGSASLMWSNCFATAIRPGTGSATWTAGAGSPEGVVSASVGSLYTRTDGSAGTTLYIKESGAGNTGWAAK